MKKILWLGLILPFLAFVSFDWITTQLDDRVSVDFPATPTKQDAAGNAVYTATDGKSKYVAVEFDFSKFGADSAMMAAELDKPEMIGQVKSGIMSELKGSTLVSEKDTLTSGYRTFDLVLDLAPDSAGVVQRMYSKTVFVAAKMYSLSFVEKKDAPMEGDKVKFFNSLKIK
jgi:hypothetical protein